MVASHSPLPVQFDGGPGRDVAGPGPLLDTFLGGEGDDDFFGNAGDVVDGGPGNDVLAGVGVTIDGGDGDDRATLSGSVPGTVRGGAGDDDVEGGTGGDTLDGGLGDDHLSGGNGDDALLGADGDDVLDGGRGADRLDGGAGADDLDGERGTDRITSADGASDHTIVCGQSSDRLLADRFDAVNVDCEQVDGGATPVTRAGVVEFVLACPTVCSGSVSLTTAAGVRLGGGTFGSAPPGARAAARSSRPQVRLGRRARTLLERRKRLARCGRPSASSTAAGAASTSPGDTCWGRPARSQPIHSSVASCFQ